jgi:hypothetical protein
MKRCGKCKEFKEQSEFNKNKKTRDGLQYLCRKCDNECTAKYGRKVMGKIPMGDNKTCTKYLGIAVAERLVRHIFDNVVTMPHGNPGYDFICSRDKKIDVKSSCITLNNKKDPCWAFSIKKNTIADYFLLLAFNNRTDLEPLHQWFIPGDVLNHLTKASISPLTMPKWDGYRQDIGAAHTCCSTMKEQ